MKIQESEKVQFDLGKKLSWCLKRNKSQPSRVTQQQYHVVPMPLCSEGRIGVLVDGQAGPCVGCACVGAWSYGGYVGLGVG